MSDQSIEEDRLQRGTDGGSSSELYWIREESLNDVFLPSSVTMLTRRQRRERTPRRLRDSPSEVLPSVYFDPYSDGQADVGQNYKAASPDQTRSQPHITDTQSVNDPRIQVHGRLTDSSTNLGHSQMEGPRQKLTIPVEFPWKKLRCPEGILNWGLALRDKSRKFSLPIISPAKSQVPRHSRSFSRANPPGRRLSQVVTRKISSTIGWRSIEVPEVVTQSRFLCYQYIRARLKKAGLLTKKMGFQRLRSVANLAGGWEVCEVFPQMWLIGQEMERTNPTIYGNVARHLSISITSDKVVKWVLAGVADHLLDTQVSWARIISLFAVAAGLALDCVRQGQLDQVHAVVEAVGGITELRLAPWIIQQGGWIALLSWSSAPHLDFTVLEVLLLVFFALTVGFGIMFIILRTLPNMLML